MSLFPATEQKLKSFLSAEYLTGILGLSIAYFLAGIVGLEIQSAQTGISPFWPASGILLAAFIIYGIQLWPATYFGMIALGLYAGIPVFLTLLSATGSILEAAIPLMIVRKYGFSGSLLTLRQLLLFFAIAWTGPIISASIGTLSFSLTTIQLTIPVKNIFLTWWLGNSFGMMLVASSSILLYQCYKNLGCYTAKIPMLIGVGIIAAIISYSSFQNMHNLNSALILNLMIPLVILSSLFLGFAGTLVPVSISCILLVIMEPNFPVEATNQFPLGILYLDILELWIITITGMLVSIAYKEGIQHMKYSWLSTHDGLTALRNRHFLDKKLDRLCFGLRQRDSSFCLLFLDLNKFKKVNDTAGHLVGDACLSYVARVLEQCTRVSDTIARWGGDEFMILLPECPEQTAISISRKINQQLKDNPFEHNSYSFDLSFSIGIATSQSGDTPAIITERADKASYFAKISGNGINLAQAG